MENTPHNIDREPWDITFKGTFKSIQDLQWDRVPPFAVVTGPNGAGKTHLLEALLAGIEQGTRAEKTRKQIEREEKQRSGLQSKLEARPLSISTRERITSIRKRIQEYRKYIGQFHINIPGINTIGNLDIDPRFPLRLSHTLLLEDAFQSLSSEPMALTALTSRIRKHYPEKELVEVTPFDEITEQIAKAPGIAMGFGNPAEGMLGAFQAFRSNQIKAQEAERYDEDPIPIPQPPWDEFNLMLDEFREATGLRFQIMRTSEVHEAESLRFADSDTTVDLASLSSGEKTLIGILMWVFASRTKGSLPRLLLLDEPDAHLHPDFASQVLKALHDVLCQKYGIRVVMTTHHPTTVALAPEGSVFVLDNGTIRPEKSWRAAASLSAGLFVVVPSTRYIFVEAENDRRFYESVVRVVEKRAPGQWASITGGQAVFLPASVSTGAEGSSAVKKALKTLVPAIFSGLVDGDGQIGSPPDRTQRIRRYAIENYLFDPIVLAVHLARHNLSDLLGSLAPDLGHLSGLIDSDPAQLQDLVKCVTGKAKSVVKQKKLDDRLEVPTSDTATVEVAFVNGPTLEYPQWFIDMPGHLLHQSVIPAAFGGDLDDAEKDRVFGIDEALTSLGVAGAIPVELVDTIKRAAV